MDKVSLNTDLIPNGGVEIISSIMQEIYPRTWEAILVGELSKISSIMQASLLEQNEIIQSIVEEYWKTFLDFTVRGETNLATEYAYKNNELFNNYAKAVNEKVQKLHQDYKNMFASYGLWQNGEQCLADIEKERDKLFQEYNRNPEAQKHRLGIVSTFPNKVKMPVRQKAMPIGEVAVRTAVRATIWTLIRNAIREILR